MVAEQRDHWRLGPQFRDRQRLGGRRGIVSQPQVQPHDVVPSIELESDLPIHADRFEPERSMQAHARRIRERNPRVGVDETLSPQQIEECEVERAADATPMEAMIDVHGHVDTPLIRLASPVRRRVGVTDDVPIGFEYEPWISVALRVDPPPDFGLVRYDRLE